MFKKHFFCSILKKVLNSLSFLSNSNFSFPKSRLLELSKYAFSYSSLRTSNMENVICGKESQKYDTSVIFTWKPSRRFKRMLWRVIYKLWDRWTYKSVYLSVANTWTSRVSISKWCYVTSILGLWSFKIFHGLWGTNLKFSVHFDLKVTFRILEIYFPVHFTMSVFLVAKNI